MKLIDTYFDLTQQYENKYGEKTILLMQVGAFFEVYGKKHEFFDEGLKGSNIDDFCNICELNKSVKSKVNVNHTHNTKTIKCNVVMAGFRDYVLDKYIDKLTNHGYTIAVYAQREHNPTERYEYGIYTPGTQIEESNSTISNNIMCISLYHQKPSRFSQQNKMYYGISNIDVVSGRNSVCEYTEQYYNTLTTFDELERHYSIHNPNELLVCYNSDNIQEKTVQSMIQFIGVTSKLVRIIDTKNQDNPIHIQCHNCSKQKFQKEIIHKFFHHLNYHEIFEELMVYDCGIHAFCFLLDFLSNYNYNLVDKLRHPEYNNVSSNLMLANHSLKQLNMIPLHKSEGKLSSVLDFINICSTSMGKRKLKDIISNPITDQEQLNKQYELIQYFIDNKDAFREISSYLKPICDIEKMYRKLATKKTNPPDILSLYSSLLNCKHIFAICKDVELFKTYNVFSSKNMSKSLDTLVDSIQHTIHIDVCKELTSDYYSCNIFNKGVYPSIDEIEKKYYKAFDIITCILNTFDTILKQSEKKSKQTNYCKLHETDKSGFMIKITETRAKKLMKELASIKKEKGEMIEVTYHSSYDGEEVKLIVNICDVKCVKRGNDTLITSKAIESNLQSMLYNKNNLKSEVERKHNDFCDELLTEQSSFESIIDFIINIDLLNCKSQLSTKYNYCKPVIDDTKEHSFIEAKQMRHLLIEHINQDELYVPNDITLDNNESGILLFGTNAVGKSSLIKSIGICVILAQAGFFVPCSEFTFKPFTRIFTRILGNDNIFKGLSTFAVEMSELRTILKLADKDSLVLGDELCSGTELGSAISIFLAGLNQLYSKQCKFIFATHFHEITNMDEIKELQTVHMKHMGVYYDKAIDALVYDRVIRDGPGNNMYGLEVCKSLNLPQDFIEQAYSIRNKHSGENTVSLLKTSRYNSKKIRGKCEICQRDSDEVHHMQFQKNANELGFIKSFNKNHTANLMNICETCHDEIHSKDTELKRVKTTKGYVIMEK